MWLYPKVVGFNPPERWGHSACFCDGAVYVFGVSMSVATYILYIYILFMLLLLSGKLCA